MVLQRLGLPDQHVVEVAWADLDRAVEADHLTSVFVPPVATPVAVGAGPLRRAGPHPARAAARGTGSRPTPASPATSSRRPTRWWRRSRATTRRRARASSTWRRSWATCCSRSCSTPPSRPSPVPSPSPTSPGASTTSSTAATPTCSATRPATPASITRTWEEIKRAEKGRASVMEGIPKALPSLLYAHKVLSKAERIGAPLCPAADPGLVDPDGELGSALLALVVHARREGIDAEAALRRATDRLRDEAMRHEGEVRPVSRGRRARRARRPASLAERQRPAARPRRAQAASASVSPSPPGPWPPRRRAPRRHDRRRCTPPGSRRRPRRATTSSGARCGPLADLVAGRLDGLVAQGRAEHGTGLVHGPQPVAAAVDASRTPRPPCPSSRSGRRRRAGAGRWCRVRWRRPRRGACRGRCRRRRRGGPAASAAAWCASRTSTRGSTSASAASHPDAPRRRRDLGQRRRPHLVAEAAGRGLQLGCGASGSRDSSMTRWSVAKVSVPGTPCTTASAVAAPPVRWHSSSHTSHARASTTSARSPAMRLGGLQPPAGGADGIAEQVHTPHQLGVGGDGLEVRSRSADSESPAAASQVAACSRTSRSASSQRAALLGDVVEAPGAGEARRLVGAATAAGGRRRRRPARGRRPAAPGRP